MIPADLQLPPKFKTFRNRQLEIAAKITHSQSYAYMLDAPTGVGKSLIAATVQRLLNQRLTYLCTTKQLQDQLLRDFPYAKQVKGRSNYRCLKYPSMFPNISAAECTHKPPMNECKYISACPYVVAKEEALHAPLAILNTAYFLSEANYVGGFSDASFLVIDEFDTLEDQLMGFIEVVITQKQLSRLDVAPPKLKTRFESWVSWANETLKALVPELARLERMEEEESTWSPMDLADVRRKTELERLVGKLRFFVKEVDNNWVWYPEEERWTFKPVWVAKYSQQTIWKHAKRILGMSATILDPRQISANVGLALHGKSYDYLQMPSPFPKSNRPVYYEPCASVIRREMDDALPRLARAVQGIMDKHPDDRILVHTVSYVIRNYLKSNLETARIITHDVRNRVEVLDKFKTSEKPLVLLSPSMDRGVDLPDDECRVVVITKMPYAGLGDPQVNRRIHASKDGNRWYAHKTVSTIIQMAGRGVRSETDFAVTYVLDKQFEKLFNEHRSMFPAWFKESVVL